ncbi:MAG: aminoglycoside phosphotransferase family protein [Thermosynechococcaceae cyanobacterium MS004]|nr:aminoglycoside phosphotransferase family protein [Thermosynechococcaceae cyanobacterium MS004]
MLHSADQTLIERDRAIPGLAMLLDDDALLGLLKSRHPHLNIQAVQGTYLRYKPYTNCLVTYQVTLNQQTHWIYAKAFSTEQFGKLRKYGCSDRLIPSRLSALKMADLGIAIAPFPVDQRLQHLPQLVNPDAQPSVLISLLPAEAALSPLTLKPLNYKPERRYVGQLTSQERQWAIKAYSPEDYLAAYRCNSTVQSREVLRVAPLVGQSDLHQMLAFDWVGDRPLPDLIRTADPGQIQRSLIQVGIALAELHHQSPSCWEQQDCTTEAFEMIGLVPDLCHLYPAGAPQFAAIAAQIAEGLLRIPQQRCATHGDFKPDQVLIQGNTVTVLDFDRAAIGHPARDLGSFLAQLARDGLQGKLSASRRHAATQGLLQGYRTVGEPLTPDILQLYTAFHLFKLLYEPFRYRAPDWSIQTAQQLEHIQTLLQPLSSKANGLVWSA